MRRILILSLLAVLGTGLVWAAAVYHGKVDVTAHVIKGPRAVCTPAQVDFPAIPEGESRQTTVLVRNAGGQPYQGNFHVDPDCSEYFTAPDGGPFTLAAGQQRNFTIRFDAPVRDPEDPDTTSTFRCFYVTGP